MKRSIILIVLLLIPSLLFGQGFDAASLSMGKAYGAIARGIESITWNPANLALPRDSMVELNLMALNLNIANSSFNLSEYNRYFTQEGHGGFWEVDDKLYILDQIPNDGLKMYGDVHFNAFGLAAGYFAFSVKAVSSFLVSVPKEPIYLALRGNRTIEREHSFNDLEGNGYAAIRTTFSGAWPITYRKYFKNLAVGMNVSYYSGMAYAEIQKAQGSFYTTSDTLDSFFELQGRSATGGSGWSVDLGVSGELNNDWSISVNVKNVIGSINWDGSPEEKYIRSSLDSVEIGFDNSITSDNIDTTKSIGAFTSTFPTIVHIGSSFKLNEQWLFSADLEQAFSNTMGYSDQGVFSFGAQYTPAKVIPLRTGMTFGGKWGYLWGMGFGLNFNVFKFDLAYSIHRALWPTLSRGNSLAFSMKFLF